VSVPNSIPLFAKPMNHLLLRLFAAIILVCASATALAQSVPLICIWEAGPGKKQSYIVEFDAKNQSVAFNGAPTNDVEINNDIVKFVLKFKSADWTHSINRADGKMKVTKSDAADTLVMQCGKLLTNGF